MTTIRLEKLKLVYFKGQRNLEVDFDPTMTYIIGDNATGKTTIMDGFLWVLFGKDSQNRADFNIKTLDENGNAILKLDHEVTAVLDVDGVRTTFRRCYRENWIKKTGEMDGHKVDYFVDDVPYGMREYNSMVSKICPEQLFRQITSPSYFPGLKMQEQRNMLFEIVGDVTDAEVLDSLITIKNKHDFDPLINTLNSRKSLEQLKKQVAAQKAVAKKDIDDIPGRIEENNLGMPETQNWADIRNQIAEKQIVIRGYDAKIADRSKLSEDVSEKKRKIRTEVDSKLNRMDAITREVRKASSADYEKWYFTLQDKKSELTRAEGSIRSLTGDLELRKQELSSLNDKRNSLVTQYYEIFASKMEIDKDAVCCPTCKRAFEGELYDQQVTGLEEAFNLTKSAKITANTTAGKNIAARIGQEEAKVADINKKLSDLQGKISSLTAEIEQYVNNEPMKLNVEVELQMNVEYTQLSKDVEGLKKGLDKEYPLPDIEDIISKKSILQKECDTLNRELAKEEQILRTTNRNKELECILQSTQQKIAEYERTEQAILNFMKAKVSLVEERINRSFSYVRFKMFDTQVDGTEFDTCECMVDGTPYSDLNTAAKMNAGLDIINAICRAKGVTAPIFLDNRESVSELIPCSSQLINLIVEKGRRLTIQ